MTNEGEERLGVVGRNLLLVNTGNKISDVTFSIFRSDYYVHLCLFTTSPSSFSFQRLSFNAKEVSAEPTTIT